MESPGDHNQKLVALHVERCRQVAGLIEPLKMKSAFYSRPYLNVDADRETRFRMHFFAVAICHQTHNLHHRDLNLYGWDYIEHVFVDLAKSQSGLLDPDFLLHNDLPDIAHELASAFSATGKPADTTLDRLEERARLMRDAASHLVNTYDGQVERMFSKAHNLLRGQYGLYLLLPEFEAFGDPQQKKSTFLIKLLEEDGLIKIEDPQHFIPIMDYHMQRVLLRLGCVEILDQDYRGKITGRKTQITDEPVRGFCIDAFKIIAEESGHPITKMNDFFWSLGRSCCHETTLCADKVCSKNPCTFAEIIEIADHSRCVFQDICPGATDPAYRALWQPVVETHYY